MHRRVVRPALVLLSLSTGLACSSARAVGQDDESASDSGAGPSSSSMTGLESDAGSDSQSSSNPNPTTQGEVGEVGEDEGTWECEPGDVRACSIECMKDEQRCDENGEWESCDCFSTPDPTGCANDNECASGFCFQVPVLGGLCGECLVDADCPNGTCQTPNPLAGTGAVCTAGALGDGCQQDGSCQAGLECVLSLVVPGILENYTCGECSSDADCSADPLRPLCGLDTRWADFLATRQCIGAGVVPLGEACDIVGSGDQACASNICAAIDVMGLATSGVCSECDDMRPCAGGQTCAPPTVDLSLGFTTPATCE